MRIDRAGHPQRFPDGLVDQVGVAGDRVGVSEDQHVRLDGLGDPGGVVPGG
jgi:hypothetical protein